MKFQHGQWWRARNGTQVRIVIAIGVMVYGSNELWYGNIPNGHLVYDGRSSDGDLMELLPGPVNDKVPFELGTEHGEKHPRIENISDNPYPRDTEDHKQWSFGFLRGFASQR